MTDPLLTLSALLAEPGQPGRLYQGLEAATRDLVGHRLFTLLYVDGDEVARVYSNQPQEYAVAGRKRMGPTP
ncbi:MAG: GAF domain-containing protein, partial [Ferrovibrionaceae bacterium]